MNRLRRHKLYLPYNKGGIVMHRRDEEKHDPFYRTTNETNEQNNMTESIAERVHRNYDEEVATEITEPILNKDTNADSEQSNQLFGWIAVALSIISFFIAPLFFAIAGIILGVIARNRHSTLLGYSAIVLGIISIIVQLFVMPFVQSL